MNEPSKSTGCSSSRTDRDDPSVNALEHCPRCWEPMSDRTFNQGMCWRCGVVWRWVPIKKRRTKESTIPIDVQAVDFSINC